MTPDVAGVALTIAGLVLYGLSRKPAWLLLLGFGAGLLTAAVWFAAWLLA